MRLWMWKLTALIVVAVVGAVLIDHLVVAPVPFRSSLPMTAMRPLPPRPPEDPSAEELSEIPASLAALPELPPARLPGQIVIDEAVPLENSPTVLMPRIRDFVGTSGLASVIEESDAALIIMPRVPVEIEFLPNPEVTEELELLPPPRFADLEPMGTAGSTEESERPTPPRKLELDLRDSPLILPSGGRVPSLPRTIKGREGTPGTEDYRPSPGSEPGQSRLPGDSTSWIDTAECRPSDANADLRDLRGPF